MDSHFVFLSCFVVVFFFFFLFFFFFFSFFFFFRAASPDAVHPTCTIDDQPPQKIMRHLKKPGPSTHTNLQTRSSTVPRAQPGATAATATTNATTARHKHKYRCTLYNRVTDRKSNKTKTNSTINTRNSNANTNTPTKYVCSRKLQTTQLASKPRVGVELATLPAVGSH